MALVLQSFTFGLAVFFMLLGIVGVLIPLIPGSLLIWLTVLLYMFAERLNGFGAIDPLTFAVITVVALGTGLADLWLPMLGAKVAGSARRSMVLGIVGSLIGTLLFPLLGTVAGYAMGVLVGEYHKHGDLNKALRAGAGGVAGWGIATAIQLGGGLLILALFVWQVLSFPG